MMQEASKPAGDGLEAYVKVILFPQVRYLKPDERRASPAPMQPESFQFGKNHVRVDRVALCERTVSRKVGGRGFRYTCYPTPKKCHWAQVVSAPFFK